MEKRRKLYLPDSNCSNLSEEREETEVAGNAPCPCCRFITIPNVGDALAYICPVCFWEIDSFIQSENEPSDQNHGLSLFQARDNYVKYGAAMPELKIYCRSPKESEFPRK
ncbi:CPCC family cysteine-rich protein [Desulfotomaculum sp. 1211_IL3151]|uniref:CPCC family cysteine-rich protein n=1 Tax=Desulfotomaculum sp. 1211_IL3151 TaxID=3084055 RepID=UPI002FD9A6CF